MTAGLASANSTWKSIRSASAACASSGCRADPLLAAVQQALADRDQRGDQHRLLAGEVVVQRRAGHAGGGADVVHRHAVISAGGEEADRDLEDLVPARPPPGSGRPGPLLLIYRHPATLTRCQAPPLTAVQPDGNHLTGQ